MDDQQFQDFDLNKPISPSERFDDFKLPEVPKKEVDSQSIWEKGADWLNHSFLPESDRPDTRKIIQLPGILGTIADKITGSPSIEIPSARQVYDNAIRPLISPIGLLGAGAIGAEAYLGRSPKVEAETPIAKLGSALEKNITPEEIAAAIKPKSIKAPSTLIEAQEYGEHNIPAELPKTLLEAQKVGEEHPNLDFSDFELPTARSEELPVSQELTPNENILTKSNAADVILSDEPKTLLDFFASESGGARGAKVISKPANPVVAKLMNAIMEAGPLRNQQEKLYSIERAKRAQAAESVTTPGLAGHYEALSQLKGELPKIDYEGLKLLPQEVDHLVDQIRTSPRLLPYEKINGVTGLQKILTGSGVPQRNEINTLREIYGDEFGKLMEVHAGIPLRGEMIADVANTMKALRASVDFSAPLRQGLPLIHKTEFWNAAKDMFPQAMSEENFRSAQKELYERPGYLTGKSSGLQLTDLGEKLTNREEAFGSTLAEKIPVLGSLVRGSERAYTGFLNKLRADTFDNLVSKATDLNGPLTSDQTRAIAKFINTATGRGSLGRFEKIGTELNAVFFSPRLISSRLSILNPKYYIDADPFVRKEAIKSLLAIAGAGTIATGLGKLTGGTVETNPTSSDFGKAKFGNTRVDPWGGFQQYIVAAARLLTGKDTSLSGKEYDLNNPKFAQPTRLDVMENFGKSKLSPAAGLGVTLASNKIDTSDPIKQLMEVLSQPHDQLGKPIKLTREIMEQFVPMFYSDIRDIAADDPENLPLGLAGLFGMGTQTNKPSVPGGSKYLSTPHLPNIKIR